MLNSELLDLIFSESRLWSLSPKSNSPKIEPENPKLWKLMYEAMFSVNFAPVIIFCKSSGI